MTRNLTQEIMNLTSGIGVLTNEDQIKFYIRGVLIMETKQYDLIE